MTDTCRIGQASITASEVIVTYFRLKINYFDNFVCLTRISSFGDNFLHCFSMSYILAFPSYAILSCKSNACEQSYAVHTQTTKLFFTWTSPNRNMFTLFLQEFTSITNNQLPIFHPS